MQRNSEKVVRAIHFGTDGWRGVIAKDFTFENVAMVAQAISEYINRYIKKETTPRVAVGFDTRFLSAEFAEVICEVFCANGVKVYLSDQAVPTPVVSFTVWQRKLDLGIMITASHNPFEYNGVKIKNRYGGSADLSVTQRVESYLYRRRPRHMGLVEAKKKGLLQREDLTCAYIKFLRSYVDLKLISRRPYHLLMDIMHGSGDRFIARVLKGTPVKIKFLRDEYNPSFGGGRPEPIEANLGGLKAALSQGNFDLGLALDGDADRIAAFDSRGNYIHAQNILPLLLLHLRQDRGWEGGVVKTIAGTNLVDKVADFLGCKVFETPVGFKYISSLMCQEDILVGGEEAGGMGFKGYIPERDGTLAGLLLLEMMAARNKPMHKIIQEMEKRFGSYVYLRDDLHLEKKPDLEPLRARVRNILSQPVVRIKDYDGLKFIAQDGNWLMFRASGTEALIRVYAEASTCPQAQKIIAHGRALVEELAGSRRER